MKEFQITQQQRDEIIQVLKTVNTSVENAVAIISVIEFLNRLEEVNEKNTAEKKVEKRD